MSGASTEAFRAEAFKPARPVLLPRAAFLSPERKFPAINNWFIYDTRANKWELNNAYLEPHGDALVPLELTSRDPSTGLASFQRVDAAPLALFLGWASLYSSSPSQAAESPLYLAQHHIDALPALLQHDLPTPSIVMHAGAGDMYGSSIWLGPATSYTPLHRDPNPNLFVQMAGRKAVRLFSPSAGRGIFSADAGNHNMRGQEMMAGAERVRLEEAVWGDRGSEEAEGLEACLESGDALFIPTGWWHSFKGVGEGITGSVNWWFR
ncbi:Clavaminate synthase-like protein [Athelia psychrophila]|uniref:Clavaminate synthase-like protein n=1 Tax=Athelia psychrophila TaxID=1759441 RepID=A0A166RQ64_9AGAM|nr:Clavaminate synthase-like protein [Fibularhizoctonia sp. CBS 109695]